MADCNKKKPCGCEDSGLTTPSPCIHDIPECPEECCSETFDSECIIYNGLGNECLEIVPGETVQEVLDDIMTSLATLKCVSCVTTVIPANGTIDLSLTPILQWGAVPGATMYDVWLGIAGGTLTTVSFGQVGLTYTVVVPLVVGTVYEWYIVPRSATAAAENCAHYTFTTIGSNCTNPLTLFLDTVESLVTEQVTYEQASKNLLTSGFMTNSCDTCCPDCEETGRYFLGSYEMWEEYSQTVYKIQNCPPPCCVNKQLSLANLTLFTLNEAIVGTAPGGCCDDFSSCLVGLLKYVGTGNGEIVEESSFKDSSGLCAILAWFELTDIPVEDALAILSNIVLYGLVIQCLPDGSIIISGVEAYITWYIATSQTCYLIQ